MNKQTHTQKKLQLRLKCICFRFLFGKTCAHFVSLSNSIFRRFVRSFGMLLVFSLHIFCSLLLFHYLYFQQSFNGGGFWCAFFAFVCFYNVFVCACVRKCELAHACSPFFFFFYIHSHSFLPLYPY